MKNEADKYMPPLLVEQTGTKLILKMNSNYFDFEWEFQIIKENLIMRSIEETLQTISRNVYNTLEVMKDEKPSTLNLSLIKTEINYHLVDQGFIEMNKNVENKKIFVFRKNILKTATEGFFELH